ncbi:MAG: hypothetical protein QW050_00570, partial [Candidatus Nitrosocaldaceae archaeon]
MKQFIMITVPLVAVALSIAYASTTPREFERFMSMSILGSNMMLDNYYLTPNDMVRVGDELQWYIQIYNRMGYSEYLAVRVKVLNSTEEIPDDNNHIPSPKEHIFEIREFIMHNQTITIPLKWSIDTIERNEDSISIKKMKINDKMIELDSNSINGKFRIVLELWRYNIDKHEFEFAWMSNIDKRSVWNQIWFN